MRAIPFGMFHTSKLYDQKYRRFKALVQRIVLSCKISKLDAILPSLSDLLSAMDNVTRNEASDGLNLVLDAVCHIICVPVHLLPSCLHSLLRAMKSSFQCTS